MRKRLTYSQAEDVRGRYAAGETQTAIARDLGVTPQAISMICSGKSHGQEPTRLSPEERRRRKRSCQMLADYGVTLEQWEEMLRVAQHHCEACGNPLSEQVVHPRTGKPFLVLDHDHESGAPRGVLCSRCNKTLGFVQDSIEVLDKLKEYLMKHGKAY